MNEFIEVPVSKASLAKRKLTQGVGINDAEYVVRFKGIDGKFILCPYYTVWASMLSRCYSRSYQIRRPTYKGCSVCPEWLLFSNFKLWMQSKQWLGKQLDKDLKVQGNKLYSPETCTFIPAHINNILLDCGSKRGKYLTGVGWDEKNRKFRAYCTENSKYTHLGLFLTECEAHKAYLAFKKDLLLTLALNEKDLEIKDLLLQILNRF